MPAKFIFEMHQSLDGFVDHQKIGPPKPDLFRHFIERFHGLTGMIYGRRMYEIMSYWDAEQEGWGSMEKEYAAIWRAKPKWVVSSTLKSVGSNATLIGKDVEKELKALKDKSTGEIEMLGPNLVAGFPQLIDEYRMYLRPMVLGQGQKFFPKGSPGPLKFVASDTITPDVVRLTYAPQ